MGWTAKLVALDSTGKSMTFAVEYADGAGGLSTSKYTTDVLSGDEIRRIVIAEIAGLQKRSPATALPLVGDMIVGPPPAPKEDPQPTKEEAAATAWVADYLRLRALQRAAAAGVLPPDYQLITDLAGQLADSWRDDYVGVV